MRSKASGVGPVGAENVMRTGAVPAESMIACNSGACKRCQYPVRASGRGQRRRGDSLSGVLAIAVEKALEAWWRTASTETVL